jgi:hypothetical protein
MTETTTGATVDTEPNATGAVTVGTRVLPPRRRAIDWRPILLEAFFVVLGVAVALAANEWRQGQVDRRRAGRALESIRQELTTNRQAVLGSAQYHMQLMDTLLALRRQVPAASDAPAPDVRMFSRGFVNPASLLSTAWETAVATDAIRHMPHDDVLVLARMYEQQRGYARQGEQIGTLIYGEIFARGTSGVTRNYANLTSIISTFWFRECELLLAYDRVLAKLPRAVSPQAAELPARCRRVGRG